LGSASVERVHIRT